MADIKSISFNTGFDDRSLPQRKNTLSADRALEIEKVASKLIKDKIQELRKTKPELFTK